MLLDGGIRRGSDVVKALCLGARAVLIGRAYAYGLGAGGGAGVTRAIQILRTDLVRTLKLLGCPSVEALDRSYVKVPVNGHDEFGDSGSPSAWSPEVRAMFRPAACFANCQRPARPSGWWRKPVFLVTALAFAMSVTATGRFSVRLLLDGVLSFAFIPLLGIAGLAAVTARRPDGRTFREIIDPSSSATAPGSSGS